MSSQSQSADPPSVPTIRERLDRVTDPELDESIVALDYLDAVDVDGETVTVEFTLPTAWCSPAFAWMMAVDARDEVEALPGVERAVIHLREHMHETEISDGVNARQSFDEVFPDADGGVASIRATLDEKARLARQYDAVEALLDAGLTGEQIVAVEPADLDLDTAAVYLDDRSFAVTVPADPLESYLTKARATGVLDDESPALFRTPDGDPIDPTEFELIHRRCRLAKVNVGGQGSVCDALNDARHAAGRPPLSPDDHIPGA